MHFQVINDSYYNKIITEIKKYVPEFNSVFSDDDGIYPIVGDLGRFLIDNIENKNILKNVLNFVNIALENGKSQTENVIVLEIFYKIYENDHVVDIVIPFLSEKSKEIFEKNS